MQQDMQATVHHFRMAVTQRLVVPSPPTKKRVPGTAPGGRTGLGHVRVASTT